MTRCAAMSRTIQSLKSLPASSWMMTTLIKSFLSYTSFGVFFVLCINAGRGLLDHTVAPTLPKRLQGLPGTLLCIHEPRLCGLYPDRWLWAKGGARRGRKHDNSPVNSLRNGKRYDGWPILDRPKKGRRHLRDRDVCNRGRGRRGDGGLRHQSGSLPRLA